MVALIVGAAGLRLVASAAPPPIAGSADHFFDYVRPSALDVPWPKISHRRQPWQAYAETLPARAFLDGLGVHWGPEIDDPDADRVAAALAAAGFRRVRLEIPWSAVAPGSTAFRPDFEAHFTAVLRALAAHALRPLILLNAHHGAPCPMREWRTTVSSDADLGERRLAIPTADAAAVVPGRTVVLSLNQAVIPGPLVLGLDRGLLRLSKPLDRALPRGTEIRLGTLDFAPLHSPGTAELRDAIDGWVRYLDLVDRLVTREYGSGSYDVELWNELTFGSAFLDVRSYYDVHVVTDPPDLLSAGGAVRQLAEATARFFSERRPQAHLLWGFSSTSFFRTPIRDVPAGFAGQTYHPYRTERFCYPDAASAPEDRSSDDYAPRYCAAMPEGTFQTFVQTESLIRLLEPRARSAGRPGFEHVISEHGFLPASLDIHDGATALRARAKFLLRAPLFWIAKGASALFVFEAHDDAGWGILANHGAPTAATAALRRLVDAFGPIEPVPSPRPLRFRVRASRPLPNVFDGPSAKDALALADLAVVLPFQAAPHRFVVALYVMTRDFPADMPAAPFEVAIGGISAARAIRFYDPLLGEEVRARSTGVRGGTLTLSLPLTDSPRLLVIDER